MIARAFLFFAALPALAQISDSTRNSIDDAARKVLTDTGSTSASIAVVRGGRVVYVQAFGDARVQPNLPARPEMVYKIGSITKQFVASSTLLLAEQGKLTLDDPVGRYLPGLTRGNEITIRQLLSHTSGYQDYYPLDYVAPFMRRPITSQGILDLWAKKALDFDPGTKWQYSNTNFSAVGMIIEKLSGQTLIQFLRTNVFEPLKMRSPIDADHEKWTDSSPEGYTRFATGPPRPAPPEGTGWLNAAGELAMTAGDLALWDISLMDGTVLKPDSLRALTKEMDLKNGTHTGYALGLSVGSVNGRRRWSHGGGTSGFTSSNVTLPDDRAAVVVLTNSEGGAAGQIEGEIEKIITEPSDDPQAAPALDRTRRLFTSLQNGKLDRSLLTEEANAYFTPAAIADYAASLKPLGTPTSFTQSRWGLRGGMTSRSFTIRAGNKSLRLSTFFMPDGKIAQYLIYPASQ